MPPTVIDLSFGVAAVAAWDALFLGEAIYVWRGLFRKGLGIGEEILSIDSRDLNKSIKI